MARKTLGTLLIGLAAVPLVGCGSSGTSAPTPLKPQAVRSCLKDAGFQFLGDIFPAPRSALSVAIRGLSTQDDLDGIQVARPVFGEVDVYGTPQQAAAAARSARHALLTAHIPRNLQERLDVGALNTVAYAVDPGGGTAVRAAIGKCQG